MTPPPDAPDAYRSCIVWTAKATEQEALMHLSDQEFIQAMQPRLHPGLGQILSVSPRFCYRPRRQHADRYYGDRLVLMGDAAHATHPVGGQGFNMGARDAALLASLLIQAHTQGRDLGHPALLAHYDQQRRMDNETTLFGTDLANRLFSNEWFPLQELRHLALIGVDQIPPLKQLLLRYAMGLAKQQPATVGDRLFY
jgi:2-octaprenyl-6-methoxyphenol hydroxylase